MLKKLYLDIHKNYFIKKFKLFIKSYGVGSYLNSSKRFKEEYLKLYEECLKIQTELIILLKRILQVKKKFYK